ncbi:TetR/AcrR family transcriptional regulator [Nonomuraea sediminis]|uniref:TetR/AcrR family transcriptional regulator n=1 Tax=Nonomuraea sediminis TaxID=2835864 RepID=UPI001BDD6594|nr:TetR/AcrR family transcriptional regulator [Nonomuraea sediminis]
MVGRPRSEESRKAILKAALELCARDGYQNVTLKGIAEAAGTGRQTLYRWWQTKAEVLLEAVTELVGPKVEPPPGSGDARADLVAFLDRTFTVAGGPTGPIIVGLMADAQADPVFAAKLRERLIGHRRQALREVLERGVLPEGIDPELVVDMIFGVMWYRLLNRHAPVDRSLAEEVDDLLARIA